MAKKLIEADLSDDYCTGSGRMVSRREIVANIREAREQRRRPLQEMYEENATDPDEEDLDPDEAEDPDETSAAGDARAALIAHAIEIIKDPTMSAEGKVERISRLLMATEATATESRRRRTPADLRQILEAAGQRLDRRNTRRGIEALDQWDVADFVGYLRGAKPR